MTGDILADARTRQGIALCLDRQKVVDTVPRLDERA
jgi:ABC-type oligopeptide transport system substrate-binding subunit